MLYKQVNARQAQREFSLSSVGGGVRLLMNPSDDVRKVA